MSPSQVPQPVHVLSPDLASLLRNRVEATLREDYGGISDDIPLETYRTKIPLTTYNAYEPFAAQFLAENCQEDDVRDMFSPGLPHNIAITSSTSSPKPKIFCKYQHQGSMPYAFGDGGETFWTFSLHYRQLVNIQNRDGDIVRTVPAGIGSSGAIRMRHGLEVENDHLNINLATRLKRISMLFSTSAVDMIRYMEEEWEIRNCIPSRQVNFPLGMGSKTFGSTFNSIFLLRPERAAELRVVGKATDRPGWLLKIWPMLKNIICIGSGVFSVGVPKSTTLSDMNLFKVTSQDIIEYLDVVKEENASSIVPPWLVEVGKHYEIMCIIRDGLWRYRLGDVVEIAGFDPTDGSPIIRYFERRKSVC
ncbi:hypothetical protein F5J12DRAFT_779706 [Pisolithus orientalis]|uniref:uncharacterized protein n=1 Tax=Pisolithus orientalis TaxID=936130 RepID=UPI0022252583|nr:uncharacterized protein F5J12DRAFT_779706 [Pisolithus orientalis]KAI6030597.1 hypothetical protein F5J12DRAFT_779706 [Pisolithus orientalis]